MDEKLGIKRIQIVSVERSILELSRKKRDENPLDGEVEWQMPKGNQSFWRGQIIEADYDFAQSIKEEK